MENQALKEKNPASNITELSFDSQYHALQKKRLTQITLGAMLALVLVGALQSYRGIFDEALILFAVAAVSSSVLVLLGQGKTRQATNTLLILLTLMAVIMAIVGGGLRDVVLYALPGLIIFSTMLNQPKDTLVMLALIVGFILTLGLGAEYAWWSHKTEKTGFATALILSVILVVVGLSIHALHRDMTRLLARLQAENSKYVETKKELQHLALHDTLTGLPNRRLAREQFEKLSNLAQREQKKVALLYLDLDEFKIVNDTTGHESGDHLLTIVAQRLSGMLRDSDIVCRLGGDEFLVLVNGVNHDDELGKLAKKILHKLEQVIRIQDREHRCTASVGIAVWPKDGKNFDELMKHADMAMYKAKSKGRDNYQFFDDQLQALANRKLDLINSLRSALDRQEFSLVYQPKIRLSDQTVAGAEALVRWHSKDHGLVMPGELIPLAESSGVIQELGDWVVEQACRDLKHLNSKGIDSLHISINVSVAQLQNPQLCVVILKALAAQKLDNASLDLEITESMLAKDHSMVSRNLQELREARVTLSIDDFGTGYSNLGYLQRYDVETLKIDRSFVSDLCVRPQNQAIVRAILQICEELDMQAVAEGVEDLDTANLLNQLGCQFGQGYYWAKPMPLSDFEKFVRVGCKPL